MMKNMDLTWYLEIHGEFPLSDGASIGYAARVWPLRKTLVFIPPHVGAHPEQVSVVYMREIEREIRRFNTDFTLADWKMYVCMLGQLQKPNLATHTFSLPSLNEIPNEVRGFVTEQIRKQKGSQAG